MVNNNELVKTKSQNDTLNKIIQGKFKTNKSFNELNEQEKIEILKYTNNKKIRIFCKKGYDALYKKFFSYEYKLINEIIITKYNSYDDFESYYLDLNGDIYCDSCYFGYYFTNDEITKYELNKNLLNFDAFISETIDDDTFEKIIERKKEKDKKITENRDKIIRWISRVNEINSYDSFIRKYNYFEKNYTFFGKEVFFSLIIQKFQFSIKEFCIKFASLHDESYGLKIEDILFYYGKEALIEVINNLSDALYSPIIKKNKIKKMKSLVEHFSINSLYKCKSGFDWSKQLFYVLYRQDYDDFQSPFEIKKYILDFEELAKELNNDLSKCDLSLAPIDNIDIKKYQTDSTTIIPTIYNYSKHMIEKEYSNLKFCVKQKWFDDNGKIILSDKKNFNFFFDFYHYLKGNLIDSDLLECDLIVNLKDIKSINFEGIKVRSTIAKSLNLKQEYLSKDLNYDTEFNISKKYEIETNDNYSISRINLLYEGREISYISDIHLLHQYKNFGCETVNDAFYINRRIINNINKNKSIIQLFGGDISGDYFFYENFIRNLNKNVHAKNFFVLGNHEMWPFDGYKLDIIISKYRDLLNEHKMFLLHNNIYYFEDIYFVKEITTKELTEISDEKLRQKLRTARLIIFGGIGFSGYNEEFNADNGIYKKVLNREQEIQETIEFENLYKKVTRVLFNKNVIIFTHMPLPDWLSEKNYQNGFVYVSGHNHKNEYYDDGQKRLYADNQVGYYQKEFSMKKFSINTDYDLFSDHDDGIHEINRNDYIKFYRGFNELVTFNRKFEKLYMIKRENAYIFFMKNKKGKLQILNGGSVKNLENNSIEYYYENLPIYVESIKMYLREYDLFQKHVSQFVKEIGGNGEIHGCIVDIDYYNHLYINPIDGTIVPYFANSVIEKYVYKNLQSLLKCNCTDLFLKYKTLQEENLKNYNLPTIIYDSKIYEKAIYVESTEMYRISRIIKGLQYTTKYNIVRLWNNRIDYKPSKELGQLIIRNMIISEDKNDKY